MQYREEMDGEVVYDDLMQPSFISEKRQQKNYSYYSQWGPKRPRHTIDYPSKKSQKCGSFRRCVYHPLSMSCIILLIIMAVLVIVACMVLLSFYAVGGFIPSPTKSMDYGPGDTQSLFFSTMFCEELIASEDTLYNNYYKDSYLYLLNKAPSLSGEKTIKFGDTIRVYDNQYEKSFHLFPGSKISIVMCAEMSELTGYGSFYLVQGKANYSHWEEEANHTNYVAFMHVMNICNEDDIQELEFNVIEEDQYYLLFINSKVSQQIAEIDANFTIERKLYSFNNNDIIKSCRFNSQACSLKVPFQTSTSVLLVYGEPKDWESSWANRSVDIMCIPRVWFYTVLVAVGVLLIVLSTFFGCVTCWCCSHALFKEDEAEKPLLGSHTERLYSEAVGKQEEMHNPTKFEQGSKQDIPNQHAAPVSNSRRPRAGAEPHPPPSFRRNSFGAGTTTHATFTGH